MFNLYQILTGAQGGQALDNLAARFGLTREQADSAVKALMPALSTAFMTKAMHPGGIQEIAGAMADDHHKRAYADSSVAVGPETRTKGADIASSIFGNQSMVDRVLGEASRYTGVSEETLRQMLPIVVSIVIGGAATAMHNQGVDGWLNQLSNSGLGNILGQGGASGGLGSILGGMFGGLQPAQGGGFAPQSGMPGMPGIPPAMQAGMEAFGKMFQPGVQGPFGQMGNFGEQIASILSGKRG